MFTIDVGVLEPGVHTLSYSPSAEALGLDPEEFRDVQLDARLDVSERRVLVFLTARATAKLECDRTLRLFDQEIEGTYDLLYAPVEFVHDNDAYDEVRGLDPAEHELDVTDVVRDTILLAVPARCVAPGAEEEEIQTTFGLPEGDKEEPKIDPRWEALKALKSDDAD